MPVISTLAGVALISTAAAAANAASGGPDYVGIAAVIAACASAFGTIIAGVITILRYLSRDEPITPEDVGEAVEKAVDKALKRRDAE